MRVDENDYVYCSLIEDILQAPSTMSGDLRGTVATNKKRSCQ